MIFTLVLARVCHDRRSTVSVAWQVRAVLAVMPTLIPPVH
jgi:hypothetical protein